MTSLITAETRLMVSSVLKGFGKQHLTDGNVETCWNSEQGLPQHILIDFGRSVVIEEIMLIFQGGFAGKKCAAIGSLAESPNVYNVQLTDFYPEDVNLEQTFSVVKDPKRSPVQRLKIVFEESTDFYGRIIVYKLDVLGKPSLPA